MTGLRNLDITFADEYDWDNRDHADIPECPACHVRDAVELASGEWVCHHCRTRFIPE